MSTHTKSGVRSEVRFLLGWEPVQVSPSDTNRTVLQYLRSDVHLPGTKEGCAEGDCGACTVLVGELIGEKVRYQAVNACILFMAGLDGKQILVVEHISFDGLHPIQQAMIDLHGSQCGFCTPGVVMSLMAHHLNSGSLDRQDLDNALAGNLCRCTGYGPIIAAARTALKTPNSQAWASQLEAAQNQLTTWAVDTESLCIETANGSFHAPRSTAELLTTLSASPKATIVAGATDLGLWVTKLGRRLEPMIALGEVRELKAIEQTPEGLRIGAAVTYTEAQSALDNLSGSLGELVRRIGSTQVRNRGTVCGNIANGSPIGDMPPALIALNAKLTLQGPAGKREIALEDFFIEYGRQDLQEGEIVESVWVPAPTGTYRSYKISKRFDQDISAVMAGIQITISGGIVSNACIAFGGMAATPARAKECEAALTGKPWNMDTVGAAMEALDGDFTPMTDARASEAYRSSVARNLLVRFYHETSSPDIPVQLANRLNVEGGAYA